LSRGLGGVWHIILLQNINILNILAYRFCKQYFSGNNYVTNCIKKGTDSHQRL